MKAYDYKVLKNPTEEELDHWGAAGFQLVAIDDEGNFYLAREREED